MTNKRLTFEVVDDLVGAHARGRLPDQPSLEFVVSDLCPLVELMFGSSTGRYGPLLETKWLDLHSQIDFRTALLGPTNLWLDKVGLRGFMRTTFDPLDSKDDIGRTRFLMSARTAAEAAGLPKTTAQSLAAAIREMESNIHEHSGRPTSGIIAFQSRSSVFEFVAADAGLGVLATLRQAKEFADLDDHGSAIHAVLQESVSRYGRNSGRGNGFRDLFSGLAHLNANLRFRSGDHALLINGPTPELKTAHLAQKTDFRGFLAAVRCEPMRPPSNTRH